MRLVGGVPVDRRTRNNAVQQMVDEFTRRDELCLAIRQKEPGRGPITGRVGSITLPWGPECQSCSGLLDYRKKVGGLFEAVDATGDLTADMDKIRAFYANASGKYPQDFGPIRLREESNRKAD